MSFKNVTDKIFCVDKDIAKNSTVFSMAMIISGLFSIYPFDYNIELVMSEIAKTDVKKLLMVCGFFIAVAMIFKKLGFKGITELFGTMPFICILSHVGIFLVGLPEKINENMASGLLITIGTIMLILTLSPLISIYLFRDKIDKDKLDEKEESIYHK